MNALGELSDLLLGALCTDLVLLAFGLGGEQPRSGRRRLLLRSLEALGESRDILLSGPEPVGELSDLLLGDPCSLVGLPGLVGPRLLLSGYRGSPR